MRNVVARTGATTLRLARIGKSPLMLVLGIACVLPQSVRAQLARVGGEFQINSYTPGVQRFSRVAGLPDGGFVVAWTSEGQDGDADGVFGRRFGADGQALTAEFQVNSTTTGSQRGGRVAVAGDGMFLVVWSASGESPIMGQRFDAAANRLGSEFAVRDDDFHDVFSPDVTATAAGRFVVVWGAGTGLDPFGGFLIRGRILDADAQPMGPAFFVSQGTPGYGHDQPAVASGRDNSFIVVWYADVGTVIAGKIVDSTPQPTGPAFTIADVEKGLPSPQICAHQDGHFVVTWSTCRTNSLGLTDHLVMYRHYDETGNALTPPLRVTNDEDDIFEASPRLACGPQGQTTIAWTDSLGIRGRSFPDVSLPDSSREFRIDSVFTRTSIGGPSVAMLAPDDFVLTWTECDVAGGCDVFGQRFTLLGPTDCPGDCNRDGLVTVDELIKAINIALGSRQISMKDCLPADPDLNYSVSIDELVTAVDRALGGCP